MREEEDSCKPSSQRTDLIHEELHACTSTNMEKVPSDDASNKNGHGGMCEAALTPSRKRSVFVCLLCQLYKMHLCFFAFGIK